MEGMEDVAEYISNSNDCFNINLKRAGSADPAFEEPFHPQFTYPIFGDEEVIVGYSNLALDLTFRANDMRPSLAITYDDARDFGEQKRMDIKGILADFLPDYVYEKSPPEEESLPDAWRPPGKLQHAYRVNGKHFEIWVSDLADPTARELFRRFQILVPLYIEGGTMQTLDDPDWTMQRWKLFLIYETTPLINGADSSPYTFVGFSTSYRLWVFPSYEIVKATGLPLSEDANGSATNENDPSSMASWRPPTPPWDSDSYNYKDPKFDAMSSPSRERVSQFVILPPYQGQSHGTHLYSAMVSVFTSDPNVFEITVEDPNEAFDDLRDLCDLPRLRQNPKFLSLSLPGNVGPEHFVKTAPIPVDLLVDQTFLTNLRHSSKISPRQFARLTEMQLLSSIPFVNRSKARIVRRNLAPNENDRRYYFWRLLVKERIYQKNLDQLAQLEVEERKEKVDQACDAVQEEYSRLLKAAEKRAKWGAIKMGNGVNEPTDADNGKGKGVKRRRIVEDDEDDEDDSSTERQVAGKKPKTGI